ncbi:hypothetical protein CERZMDRAFT_89481 [Cercospora zeae-maydis SCOH1-5]|uniref:Uncharacterized protein n=1 Tax=Cercospora zeae-maydis SCOH1-5 TaxID=717836 RepID=A0A6A6EYG8_9PEZI|nr:hypothetical protein CERZMDRAFT_89481 [Cercospora zeae-maydis SCOH1-5]
MSSSASVRIGHQPRQPVLSQSNTSPITALRNWFQRPSGGFHYTPTSHNIRETDDRNKQVLQEIKEISLQRSLLEQAWWIKRNGGDDKARKVGALYSSRGQKRPGDTGLCEHHRENGKEHEKHQTHYASSSYAFPPGSGRNGMAGRSGWPHYDGDNDLQEYPPTSSAHLVNYASQVQNSDSLSQEQVPQSSTIGSQAFDAIITFPSVHGTRSLPPNIDNTNGGPMTVTPLSTAEAAAG